MIQLNYNVLLIHAGIILVFAIVYYLINHHVHKKKTEPFQSVYHSVTCHLPFVNNEFRHESSIARASTLAHAVIVQVLLITKKMVLID